MTAVIESYLLPKTAGTMQPSGSNSLGKDDFLKLLIAQLQNQDPTNPMDDREFIAQMATFSSLEQMTNMNQSLQRFVDMQTTQSLVQHSELIGEKVKWLQLVDVDEYRQEIQYLENTVTSVRLENDGSIRLQLDDGRWISNYQLVQIGLENNKEDPEDEEPVKEIEE